MKLELVPRGAKPNTIKTRPTTVLRPHSTHSTRSTKVPWPRASLPWRRAWPRARSFPSAPEIRHRNHGGATWNRETKGCHADDPDFWAMFKILKYWLVDRDPSIGLWWSPIYEWYNPVESPTNRGFELCSYVQPLGAPWSPSAKVVNIGILW